MNKIISFFIFTWFSLYNIICLAEYDICKETDLKCNCELKGKINVCKTYYKNGNLESEINLKGDKYYGEFKKYYENGNLFFVVNYINDLFEGIMVNLDEDGTFQYFGNFKNNKEQGLTINYDKKKNEFLVAEYQDGKLIKLRKYTQSKETLVPQRPKLPNPKAAKKVSP